MNDELKACPFCGKETAEVECDGAFWWVECQSCGASGHVYWFILNNGNARDIVIDNWNTRSIEDALNARIAELEAAQRWIPVSERLPEDGDFVLIWDEMNGAYIAEHSKQVPQWAADGYYRHGTSYKYITHWMPLPEVKE